MENKILDVLERVGVSTYKSQKTGKISDILEDFISGELYPELFTLEDLIDFEYVEQKEPYKNKIEELQINFKPKENAIFVKARVEGNALENWSVDRVFIRKDKKGTFTKRSLSRG